MTTLPKEVVPAVLGIDFGTDSVRAVLLRTDTGAEVASAVCYYPRWKAQRYCDPARNQYRQHPLDYTESLESVVRACLAQAGPHWAAAVRALSADTTGSTPVAVDRSGTPLALLPEFSEDPDAMFVLWKDHSAIEEAEAINSHAALFGTDYLAFVGGIYSSEWFWAKLLHVLRANEAVRNACYSWVEHCDWIPFLLTGGSDVRALKHSICAAGHKSLWSDTWGGLPPEAFLASLDPLLYGFRDRLFHSVYTSDQPAGTLCAEWAERLGLPAGITVGIGAFDCHMGAVGGQAEPYHLSKVMGTSTCDMLVAPLAETAHRTVSGICGQVPGSIIPGMMGFEAGQSAFGDAFAWMRDLLSWPLRTLLQQTALVDSATATQLAAEAEARLLTELSAAAAALPPDENDELALDWLNGRRTPDADQQLTAAFTGLRLATDAPRLFRALAEATCFGARAIVERFEEQGLPIRGIIGLGGVAQKSPYLMQLMADVLQRNIRIHRSEQTCAAGAAMFAATAAGLFPNVEAAMQAMGQGFEQTYTPNSALAVHYDHRYHHYRRLGRFVEGASATPPLRYFQHQPQPLNA